jgi:LmbE family N-acetylglucosaminyl deacetylase
LTADQRLVVIFAHPDDESFGFGGVLSAAADAGWETTYVVGTRGEVGEILVPEIATRETLGQVREGELRAALDLLGVAEVRFLGYRDSGMDGTPENRHPDAFVNQNVDAVAGVVAEIMLEKRPTAVITYGPDGIYGHPDHIMAHKVGYAAVLEAGERGWQTPNLYYSSASRERIRRMASHPNSAFAKMAPELVETFGTPAAEITTWMDIRAFADRKLAALKAHRSQVGDDGPFAQLAEEERKLWLSVETARMVPLPWNPDPRDILHDLLPHAPTDHPFRS